VLMLVPVLVNQRVTRSKTRDAQKPDSTTARFARHSQPMRTIHERI